MSSILLCPQAAAPDVEELLTQAIYEVEEIAQHKYGYLIAVSSHFSLALLLCFLVGNLLH